MVVLVKLEYWLAGSSGMREAVACVCMEMREAKTLHSLEPRAIQKNDISRMGLLPDTSNCRLRMRRECRERFPTTAGERSRHASRHVRNTRAVMHVGIAN